MQDSRRTRPWHPGVEDSVGACTLTSVMGPSVVLSRRVMTHEPFGGIAAWFYSTQQAVVHSKTLSVLSVHVRCLPLPEKRFILFLSAFLSQPASFLGGRICPHLVSLAPHLSLLFFWCLPVKERVSFVLQVCCLVR